MCEFREVRESSYIPVWKIQVRKKTEKISNFVRNSQTIVDRHCSIHKDIHLSKRITASQHINSDSDGSMFDEKLMLVKPDTRSFL